jgi:Protein of unknown function (DUF3617)
MKIRAPRSLLHCMLLALLSATSATAQDLSPGLWEISVEAKVPASPGFAPAPFKLTQCVSAQDVRDPAKLLAGMANPGATGCTYGNSSLTGNTLRFTMQCAGTLDLRAAGEVSFTPASMNGAVVSTSNIGGQKVEMQSIVAARRLGNC